MSSYFDQLSLRVHDARKQHRDDEQYLTEVAAIESELFADVSAATGDREFPDDLREKMMGVLAAKSVYQLPNLPPNEWARERALFGSSRAIEDMHELFHDLARRRIATRFCPSLPDSPTYIVALRDDHDNPTPSGRPTKVTV